MHNRTLEALATPHVGGKLAVAIFILTLLGFVIETELTQVSAISASSSLSNLILNIPSMSKQRLVIASHSFYCELFA